MNTETETLETLSALSDGELNVRLAKLLGYTFHDVKTLPHTGEAVFGKFWLRPGVKIETLNADDICWREGTSPPRFCSDLNETAKVEAGLTDQNHCAFLNYLEAITEPPPDSIPWREIKHNRAMVSATARQRTIALILTLQTAK